MRQVKNIEFYLVINNKNIKQNKALTQVKNFNFITINKLHPVQTKKFKVIIKNKCKLICLFFNLKSSRSLIYCSF